MYLCRIAYIIKINQAVFYIRKQVDQMAKENREYKDSLFVDLFYSDETAKKNLLSLYNALHGTDLKDEGLIRKVKIEE